MFSELAVPGAWQRFHAHAYECQTRSQNKWIAKVMNRVKANRVASYARFMDSGLVGSTDFNSWHPQIKEPEHAGRCVTTEPNQSTEPNLAGSVRLGDPTLTTYPHFKAEAASVGKHSIVIDSAVRGPAIAEDAQGTHSQSHRPQSILVYEGKIIKAERIETGEK